MNSLLVGLMCLCSTLASSETSTETCKCWDGYEQRNGTDGPECAGIFLRNVMPCNILRVPSCVCTGNVSRILIENGTSWCSALESRKETKRWGCENKEEWEEYEKEFATSTSTTAGTKKATIKLPIN